MRNRFHRIQQRQSKRVRTDYDEATDTLIIARREKDLLTGETIEHVETIPAYMQTIRLEAYLKSEMILPENARKRGLI